MPQQIAAPCDRQNEDDEPGRPQPGLCAERNERFDQYRVRQQRQEAADIAGGVEEIGIVRGRMVGAREPCLQQRRVGRQCEEGRSDRDREQAEQPECFALHRRTAPVRRDGQRQPEAGDHQQGEMDHHRAAAGRKLGQRMGIAVAGEQRSLEEHHGHRPHRRCTAEPRQHQLGEHRLHRKQQCRAQKNGCGKDHQKLGHPRGLRLGSGGRGQVGIGHDCSLIRRGAGAGKPGIQAGNSCLGWMFVTTTPPGARGILFDTGGSSRVYANVHVILGGFVP